MSGEVKFAASLQQARCPECDGPVGSEHKPGCSVGDTQQRATGNSLGGSDLSMMGMQNTFPYMPIEIDPAMPKDEIRFMQDGVTVGTITNIKNPAKPHHLGTPAQAMENRVSSYIAAIPAVIVLAIVLLGPDYKSRWERLRRRFA